MTNNPVNMLVFNGWLPIIGLALICAVALGIIMSFIYWWQTKVSEEW